MFIYIKFITLYINVYTDICMYSLKEVMLHGYNAPTKSHRTGDKISNIGYRIHHFKMLVREVLDSPKEQHRLHHCPWMAPRN